MQQVYVIKESPRINKKKTTTIDEQIWIQIKLSLNYYLFFSNFIATLRAYKAIARTIL